MKDEHNMKHGIHALMFIAIIALVVALVIVASKESNINITSDGQIADKSVISVVGQSFLEVDPDQATVTLTIETKGDTATSAQADNKISTNKVLDALKGAGIKADNIETTSYYLSPQRRWDSDEQKYVDQGYTQIHSLKVTIEEVTKVGGVIDTAVRAGVNGVGNIQFALSDDLKEEKQSEALEQATKEAGLKAKSIADSLNTKIIKISRVSESNVEYQPYRYYDYAVSEAAMGKANYEETSISPQDVTINAMINIEYVIEG